MIAKLDRALKGWPETTVTAALLISAAAIAWVALTQPATIKTSVALWVWLP